jgi:negative regulator of flagellin synthesis FlgM
VTNKIGTGGVDNRPVQVANERSVKRAKDASVGAPAQVEKPSSGNSGVQITDSARQLAALEQAIRSMPDVDQAKVDEIRNAIANGTYKVSPDRIAEKLLRMENDLR